MAIKLLCIGNVGVDIYEDGAVCAGGHAVNTAAYFRKIGAEAAVISAIGDDGNGKAVLDALDSLGIDRSHLRVIPGGETGYCQIHMDGGNAEISCGNKGGVLREKGLSLTQEDKDFMKQFSVLHFDVNGHCDGLLPEVKELHVPISYDFGTFFTDERIAAVAPYATFAFISCEGMEEQQVKDAMAKIQKAGPTLVYAMCGARGSIAYDGHRYYKATARPTIPVDTLGAGDAFAAGVLHHLAAYIDYRGWTDVADGRFIPASITSEAPYCGDVCSHRALLVKGAFDTAPINLSYTKRFAYKLYC